MKMLDRIAAVTRQKAPALAEAEALYCDALGIAVPDVVMSMNPTNGEPFEMRIKA